MYHHHTGFPDDGLDSSLSMRILEVSIRSTACDCLLLLVSVLEALLEGLRSEMSIVGVEVRDFLPCHRADLLLKRSLRDYRIWSGERDLVSTTNITGFMLNEEGSSHKTHCSLATSPPGRQQSPPHRGLVLISGDGETRLRHWIGVFFYFNWRLLRVSRFLVSGLRRPLHRFTNDAFKLLLVGSFVGSG